MDEIVKQIYKGIIDGQQNEVAAGVDAALQAGVPARTILDEGMLAAMAEVGRLFEDGECWVAVLGGMQPPLWYYRRASQRQACYTHPRYTRPGRCSPRHLGAHVPGRRESVAHRRMHPRTHCFVPVSKRVR